jgi:hypothetical protein
VKKVLVGCLLFVLLAGVGIAAGGYFFVYRPVATFAANMNEFQEWESRVDDQTPFTPPEDGLLTQDQVTRFVSIYDGMVAASGTGLQDMQAALSGFNNTQNPDLQQLREMFGELARGFEIARETREAQVEAINAQNMSVQEYRWVRQTVMSSLIPVDRLGELTRMAQNGDLTPERIQEMMPNGGAAAEPGPTAGSAGDEGKPAEAEAGDDEDKPGQPAVAIPIDPANSALVAEYRERAPRWIVLYLLNF